MKKKIKIAATILDSLTLSIFALKSKVCMAQISIDVVTTVDSVQSITICAREIKQNGNHHIWLEISFRLMGTKLLCLNSYLLFTSSLL